MQKVDYFAKFRNNLHGNKPTVMENDPQVDPELLLNQFHKLGKQNMRNICLPNVVAFDIIKREI